MAQFNELRLFEEVPVRVWGAARRFAEQDAVWLIKPNGLMRLVDYAAVKDLPVIAEVEDAFPIQDLLVEHL